MPGLSHTRAYIALLVIVALWGSYPAAAKLALRAPPLLVTVRCAIASGFLIVLLARTGAGTVREITPAALRAFAVLALTGIVGSTSSTHLSLTTPPRETSWSSRWRPRSWWRSGPASTWASA